LDLMMPVMDGFQFRERQVADPLLAKIPVIIMTADGNIIVKRERIGAVEAFRKPLDVDSVLTTLERLTT
jgi:CheY-like chemotaxis protein